MEESSKPIIVAGLSTRKGILALIIGVMFGFIIYFMLLYFFEQNHFPLKYYTVVSTGISMNNVFAIKILLGFLSCISVQAIMFPLVMTRIHPDVYILNMRVYFYAMIFTVLGMIVQYFTINILCDGTDSFKTYYIIGTIIAILQFIVIWIDFVRKYKKESFMWVLITMLLSLISAGAYSIIL